MIKLLNKIDFNTLGRWHIIALSIIAAVIVLGQILIQVYLENQVNDSRVVNLAGRQRMLSQRITLYSSKLNYPLTSNKKNDVLKTLESSINLWKLTQEGLIHGNDSLNLPGNNSNYVVDLYKLNQPYYNAMLQSGLSIVEKLKSNIAIPREHIEAELEIILENEPLFLETMDTIVFQYDHEAWQRVKKLSTIGYILLAFALTVILLVVVFIFIPTANYVKRTIQKLLESEQHAQKMTKEINTLYLSLEKSYKELTEINISVENPRMIAKADKGGNLIWISDSYVELTGFDKEETTGPIANLFHFEGYTGDFMDTVIDELSEGKCIAQEINFIGKSGNEIWLDLHIVPVYDEFQNIEELMVLASNLTEKKYAETSLKRKDLEWIEKKIKEQKYRSVLILEGQEEERKRIAMDIHDGIGQLLTSLKFQIESVNLNNYHDSVDKLYKVKELIKQIIRETRRVTFDLKPSVLSDYGINAGLGTYVKEIDKLTDIKIIYENTSNFDQRLTKNVENNIYRIIQEAVNNAIKYSGAETVKVMLGHDDNFLYLEVVDTGKGFNSTILNTHQMQDHTGNGIFNMQERADYINGEFEIESIKGTGTSVKLKIPLFEKEIVV